VLGFFHLLSNISFAEINRKPEELIAKGFEIINIVVQDPRCPVPAHIVQAMHEAIQRMEDARIRYDAEKALL
jgi:aspartate/methionine/tyrosine aminotransferase